MSGDGKILEENPNEFQIWEPSLELLDVPANEARYSRGFLARSPMTFFSGLAELWLPLSRSLGIESRLLSCEASFVPPENVSRLVSFEANEEVNYFCFLESSAEILSKAVVPEIGATGADVVLEYLERRLLSSLSLCWRGAEELHCVYGGQRSPSEMKGAAYVYLQYSLAGSSFGVCFGIGSKLLDAIDRSVRTSLVQEAHQVDGYVVSDQIHSVSVEIAELAVPPAMLIDYIRAGTIVDLQVPKSNIALLRVDGELWAEGTLGLFDDSYAVTITSTEPSEQGFADGTTKVRVELASAELDASGIITHQQPGAVLLCDTPIRPQASLIISGENVARAIVGSIGESFAVQVLAK